MAKLPARVGSRSVPLFGAALLLGSAAHLLVAARPAAADKLRARATLAELPRSEACSGRTVRVLARYRLERTLAGRLKRPTLWVMHRCPEFARGPSKYGHGTAPPLRPGHTHVLELAPYQGNVDAAPEDAAEAPRYEALRTDLAPAPPRIAVVVTGPSGTKVRLDFDAEEVTVGRAPDSDVLLSHREVGLRQLLLEVRGDEVVVSDLLPGRARLNGAPIRKPRGVTCQDTLSVGPYALNVSLFLAPELGD